MKVENLDTAARFAKKRRTLKELGELLQNYVHHAEVLVIVTIGEKKRQASIQEETFNVLGNDAIPLFVSGGLMFVLNRIILYKTLKNL